MGAMLLHVELSEYQLCHSRLYLKSEYQQLSNLNSISSIVQRVAHRFIILITHLADLFGLPNFPNSPHARRQVQLAIQSNFKTGVAQLLVVIIIIITVFRNKAQLLAYFTLV